MVSLTQSYDGDRMRVKKVEQGVTTYYVRSSMLGGQVVAELDASGQHQRGYVYLSGQLLAMQENNQVTWVHQDPVTKSQRFTSSAGALQSQRVDLDPWGVETNRSVNSQMQPHRFTTYERDQNGSDEAMHRRYNSGRTRFDQPDPYEGSYDLTDPQSFNRYTYTQNDPVNFVDPSGLEDVIVVNTWECGYWCASSGGPDGTPPGDLTPGGEGPGGGGGGGEGGTGTGTTPQETPEQQKCDDKLASIFGGKGAVAAGNDYEPAGMPGYTTDQDRYRGTLNGIPGHLSNQMHLYGSVDGSATTGVYIPQGFAYAGRHPTVRGRAEDGYSFYNSDLGLSLHITHVANFGIRNEGGRTRIGDIGGIGGFTLPKHQGGPRGYGPYKHSHFTLMQGRGFDEAKRVPFANVFCK